MNLINKGLSVLLLTGLISSCEDDGYTTIAPVDSSGGDTMSVLSSFPATPGPDGNGNDDGTYITVTPVSVGVDSYIVDFGDGGSPVTISEQGGSASYDYPNADEETDYTITVTTKAAGQSDITKSEEITVIHTPIAISVMAPSPIRNHADVFAIFSDGVDYDGGFVGYTKALENSSVDKEVTSEDGNSVIEYSRLGSNVGSILFGKPATYEEDGETILEEAEGEPIVVAEALAAPANDNLDGIGVTDIHFDVHSVFAEGIDKLKITLFNGETGDESVIDGIDLTNGEWASLDYNLATDFSIPVVQIDSIKFELGTGGTANDQATINVDNVYLYKAASTTILNGGFDLSAAQWQIATHTGGNIDALNGSGDGSWTNYDGSPNGSKTRGAKWSDGTSGGEKASDKSRYAYQALTLTPNTDYILEYEYAIKDDSADTEPVGGRRMVAVVLDGHFIDGADAIAAESSNLASHFGTIAEGKFSDEIGTLVQLPFTSNESGEVAIWLYAVTPQDGWIDNVKVTQAP
ncbi:hypothetical protein [Zobellia nedashkovskayae]|uniref:hypothetical protein n=1 Tax=Zobellia nedashkovskayae TaxID=2779510 RepID=UPI00188D1693|nr:hypothetical protein [Zobellia nedashkovskayae]